MFFVHKLKYWMEENPYPFISYRLYFLLLFIEPVTSIPVSAVITWEPP